MSHVTTAYDAIDLGLDNLDDVVIVGGRALGCFTALYLASRASSLQIFDSDDAIGVDLGRTTRWVILKQLMEKGVKVHTNSTVNEIDSRYIDVFVDSVRRTIHADTVVLATRPQPRDRILKQLQKTQLRTETIGSVTKPMNLLEVIHSAYDFANSLNL